MDRQAEPRVPDVGHACLELELPQEPQIALQEQPQVVDAVADHRHPLDAQAEREAGVSLGIDARRAQYVRVNQAGAAQLQPAVAPA